MTDTGHPQRIGYARVSTLGQNLDSQVDALQQAGCLKIFSDRMGGTTKERPGWEALLAYLRPGDTVVVTELSRMTRSLLHLLELVKEFEAGKIDVVSIRENIDTTTCHGEVLPLHHRRHRPDGTGTQSRTGGGRQAVGEGAGAVGRAATRRPRQARGGAHPVREQQ